MLLKHGSQGEDVKSVQEILKQLGYKPGLVDGVFGDKNAQVGASRSATSFHYTGRALDLFVGSGMENRSRDPFVVTSDDDRYWRVLAKPHSYRRWL